MKIHRILGMTIIIALTVGLIGCSSNNGGQTNQVKATEGTKPVDSTTPPSSTPKPKEQKKVVLAVPNLNTSQAPVYIAQDMGYFHEEGLDVETQVVKPQLQLQGLVGGTYQFSSSGGAAVFSAVSGLPIKIVYFVKKSVTWWLYGKKDLQSIKDLKGKKVGVESPSALSGVMTKNLLAANGIKNDDVTWMSIGPAPNWVASLKTGTVDASIVSDYETKIAVDKSKEFTLLGDYSSLSGGFSGFVTSDKLMHDDPDLVERFIRALHKGHLYMLSNPKETLEIIKKHLPDVAPALVDQAFQMNIDDRLDARDGTVSEDAMMNSIKVVAKALDKPVVPNEAVFDMSITKKIIAEVKK